MANSGKPWFSVCKLNDTPMTVPSNYQKTKEWVAPQLLEWSAHWLAYEITQLTKTNHTTFMATALHSPPLKLKKSTSYLLLCLSLNFCNKTSKAWASLGLKSGTEGFGWARVPGQSWRTGGKSSEKNVPRDPLHSLLENLLNTWPVLTVFIGLILGTEKIKDKKTPLAWVTATGAR